MMQILRTASIATAAVIILLSSGCSKDSTNTPTPDTELTPVEIIVNEVTPTLVRATFTPPDANLVYHPHVIRKALFKESWGNDVVRYMASYINHLCEMYPDVPRRQVLDELILTTHEFSFVEERLIPDTDYILFAVAVDNEGVPTMGMVTKEFHTKSVAMQDCTFDITVSDVSITRAKFEFKPSKKEVRYLSGVVLEAQYPLDAETQAEFAQVLADKWIDDAAAYYAIDRLDVIPYISIAGDQQKDLDKGTLQPNIKYLAITVGIDPSGIINTAPSVKEFTTKPANTSNNTFTIDVDKTAIGASFTVTPTNNDSYFARVFTAVSLEGVNDDRIVASLVNQGAADAVLSGVQTIDTWKEDLIPDTNYELILFGCDEWATTPVRHIAFKTDAGGNPSQCNFTFETSIKNITINYSVIPSDNSVFFFSQIMKKAELPVSDSAIIEDINAQLSELIEVQPDLLPGEVLLIGCDRGRIDSDYSVYPGSYTLFAVPLDSKTGLVAGTKVFRKEIAVSSRTVSNAALSISGKKHYDGDELAAYDPITYKEYLEIPHHAHGVLSLTPNSDAKKWYVSVFAGDLTDKNMYSDEVIIVNTTGRGTSPITSRTYSSLISYKDKQIPNTICTIAEDADGIFGIVTRELWEVEKKDASPISELVGGPKGANVRIPYRISEPEMNTGTTLRERIEAAKASGALNLIKASRAPKTSEATSSTDFVQHEAGDKIGFIR